MDMLTPPRGKQHWFCPTITSNLLPAPTQEASLWLITPIYRTDTRLFFFFLLSEVCLKLSDTLCQYWNVSGLSHLATSLALMWSIWPASEPYITCSSTEHFHSNISDPVESHFNWAIKYKTGPQEDLCVWSITELTGALMTEIVDVSTTREPRD